MSSFCLNLLGNKIFFYFLIRVLSVLCEDVQEMGSVWDKEREKSVSL